MELLERRQLLSGTVVGFEDSADLSNFAYTRVLSAGQSNAPLSQADGHDGHILQLGYTHHHDGVKFSPSGDDYLLSTGTISVDARLRYYGPTGGTANGTVPALILKQPSPAANDAYMVTLDQTGGTLRLIVGAAKEIGGSREAYKYYGPSNGHSTYASIILSGYTPILDNTSHDLGWYTIAASISGGEAGSAVTITAKVTAPEGTSYYGQWSDTGSAAWTGTGTVGIAQYSQWSQVGEFDDFTVDDEVTLFVPPVVSIEASASTVVEGETITYTVSRTGGDSSESLSVGLIVGGDAERGGDGDYTLWADIGHDGNWIELAGEGVTIKAGFSDVMIQARTLDDAEVEPEEVLTVSLGSSSTYALGTFPAAVTINDNDVNVVLEDKSLPVGSIQSFNITTTDYYGLPEAAGVIVESLDLDVVEVVAEAGSQQPAPGQVLVQTDEAGHGAVLLSAVSQGLAPLVLSQVQASGQPGPATVAAILVAPVFELRMGVKPVAKAHVWELGDTAAEGLKGKAIHHIQLRSEVEGTQIIVYLDYTARIIIDRNLQDKRGTYGHEQLHIVSMIAALQKLVLTGPLAENQINEAIKNILAADQAHTLTDSPMSGEDYNPIEGIFPDPAD